MRAKSSRPSRMGTGTRHRMTYPKPEIWREFSNYERVAWMLGTRSVKDELEVEACQRLNERAKEAK